jgi:hypothetical protein
MLIASRELVGVLRMGTASQGKLLITNNTFCIVQRATAQPKTGFFVITIWLKLLQVFKPAGLAVCIFFLSF